MVDSRVTRGKSFSFRLDKPPFGAHARLSDPYDRFTTPTKKGWKMEDTFLDSYWESQYEVPEASIYWEAEAEVIMAQWDEPDFF